MHRRMYLWDREQANIVPVPIINGNAFRGVLRRIVMTDFLALVGYDVESVKLHHALMSGGQLEAADEGNGAIDMALRKQLIDGIPPLGLLGTSIGNQILSSCLSVEHGLPVCQERRWTRTTREPMPHDEDARWDMPARAFLSEHFQTRRDDIRAEREEGEQAVQMLVTCECLIPGTLMEHGFTLRNASPVEEGALGRMLELWGQFPTIGGRSSGGMGQLALNYDHIPDSAPYLEWCESHKDQAIEALNVIVSPPVKAAKRKAKAEPDPEPEDVDLAGVFG